jgi:uncharacterized membrane protein
MKFALVVVGALFIALGLFWFGQGVGCSDRKTLCLSTSAPASLP